MTKPKKTAPSTGVSIGRAGGREAVKPETAGHQETGFEAPPARTAKKKLGVPVNANPGAGANTQATPPPATIIPEELESIWDDAVAKEFSALRKQQQDFLLVYLRTGSAATAWRQGYDRPLAGEHLASNSGYQVLEGIGVNAIVKRLQDQKTADLFMVIHGYREMASATKPEWTEDSKGQWQNVGNVPDWQARKEAYAGLRKIRALDAPVQIHHTGEVTNKVVHQYDLPKKVSVGKS